MRERARTTRRAKGLMIGDIDRRFRRRECQHPASPSACGAIINAHSISRSASLMSLADDSNHVLSFHPIETPPELPRAKPIGIGAASTFRGMCDVHDREFAPIDDRRFEASPLQCMLLAVRAIYFEIYRKSAHILSLQDTERRASSDAQVGNVSNVEVLESSREAAVHGLGDMTALKDRADEALANLDTTKLSYAVFEFEGSPVMAATGVFTPDFDLDGNRIQNLSDPTTACQVVSVSLLPERDKSFLVFAWPIEHATPAKLVDSLARRVPSQIPRVVPQLCLGYLENVYFSQSWWETQSPRQQLRLAEFARFFSDQPLPLLGHEFVDWRFCRFSQPAG